jgi:DNA-binding IclR family transcriptional regulator
MLDALLRRVAEKGIANSAELACELGVSRALLHGLLEQLDRQGYVQVVAGCMRPCARCRLRAGCLYRNPPRVWSLTAKCLRRLGQREEG